MKEFAIEPILRDEVCLIQKFMDKSGSLEKDYGCLGTRIPAN